MKKKRQRGVILSPKGQYKLELARSKLERRENFTGRYTYEQLSEISCLDTNTVMRVLKCNEGVDRRTLEKFFIALDLDLTREDYAKPQTFKRQDLREAVCTDNFLGRTAELGQLEQWLVGDRCRILNILGIAGVGKTALSAKLVQQVKDRFERVVWKSLKDAPSIDRLLSELIQFLADPRIAEMERFGSTENKIFSTIDCLRSQRCLVILDNAESLLSARIHAGTCRPECQEYAEFWQYIGEADHQSCLIVNSREKPSSIAVLEGERLPVKSLRLSALNKAEGIEILHTKGLKASELDFHRLIEQCYGNALALKIVATTINDVFAGNVAKFLSQKKVMYGDLERLVKEQIERLSTLEYRVICWLAVYPEPIAFTPLLEQIDLAISKLDLIEVLESLSRRSLIFLQHSNFTLQPIFREYLLCHSDRLKSKILEDAY